jgi:hypothetical protein
MRTMGRKRAADAERTLAPYGDENQQKIAKHAPTNSISPVDVTAERISTK